VLTRKQERLGALVLDDRVWADPDPVAVALAMCDGVRQLGLRLSPAAERFRARVKLVRDAVPGLPDMTDEALLAGLETWLAPHLQGVKTAQDWKRFDALEVKPRCGSRCSHRGKSRCKPQRTFPTSGPHLMRMCAKTCAVDTRVILGPKTRRNLTPRYAPNPASNHDT